MPSALFHAAIGLFIGLSILGDELDNRAIAVILFAAILPDVDTIFALWFPGAHRAYLHNVFVFLVPAALLVALHWTPVMPWARKQWPAVERVLWTAIIVIAVAGIGLDMFGSGVNLLYPMEDQFYHFSGNVMYSSQEGMTQTLFDVNRARVGSTETVYYASGIDPQPGPDSGSVERTFPVFGNGIQLLLSLTAFVIVIYRTKLQKHEQPAIVKLFCEERQ